MEFSKELIQVFDYIGEKVGIVIDWGSENVVPYITDLCSRYIHYIIAASAIEVVFCTVVIIIAAVFTRRFWKKTADYMDGFTKFMISAAIWVGIITIIGTELYDGVKDIVQCIFIPEIKIYEIVTQISANIK